MLRRWGGVAGGLLLLALAVRAQEAQQPPAVVFRSGVELVQLDVSVLDGDRRPVRGLTADDFTVLEDGEPRPIVAFSEVVLPAPAPATADWTREVAPDVSTNAPTEGGRLVVILLDRSIPVGLPTITAREIAEAAVEELGPNDMAAVLFTGVGTPQNFTNDRSLLLKAIRSSDPSTAPSSDAGDTETAQEVDLMNSESGAGSFQHGGCYCGLCVPETIEHVAETLRDVPRRKSLLFIGAAMQFQSTEMDCGFRLDDARTKMMRALDLANVTIHSFDPVGLEVVTPAARTSSPIRSRADRRQMGEIVSSAITANLSRQGSLEVLPDRTGGRTVANTNAPGRAMEAVFAESSSYYLLAFEAGTSERGETHDLQVRTARRGTKVQTRRRYRLDEEGPTAGGPLPAAVVDSLSRATRSAEPVSDIPLGMTVAPFAVPGSEDVDLIVSLGLRYPVASAVPMAEGAGDTMRREEIRVLSGAYDAFARPRASDERSLVLTIQPETAGELAFESFSRLSLRPGTWEIRVAASSAAGVPSGSVFTHVEIPAFRRAALSLSGLVLSAEPGWPAAAGDVLTDRLPIVPTSRRDFARTDRVTAFVRVYQGGDGPLQAVTGAIRLTTANGLVAVDRTLSLEADAFDIDRSADVRVDLPLTNLNPGEHLLTVDVAGRDVEASRDIRLAVR